MRKRIVFAVMLTALMVCLTACGKSKDVLAAESAISNIGEVTLDSADSIIAAQKLFEGLGESERKSVSNYQELADAINMYTQLEEEYYQECYNNAVFKMLDTLVIAEELCNQTMDVWHNTIWQIADEETDPFTKDDTGIFYDDFNVALEKLNSSADYQSKADAILENNAGLEELVSIIKMPPDKFKGNMLDAFVNYYTEYQSFIQFALYHNESYNSFSEKFDGFEKTSIEAYRKAAFYTSQG